MLHHNEHEGNRTPDSTEEKLKEIYARIVKNLNTDATMDVLLRPNEWCDELVEGVKTKILNLSRN